MTGHERFRIWSDDEERIADAIREMIQEKEDTIQALRRSETRRRAVLDAIPDLMFQISEDGTFLDYKAAAVDELALPPGAFLGKKVQEVMPPWFAQQVMRYVEQALQTGEMQIFEGQLPVPFPDGDMRDYEVRLVVSGEREVLTIVRDITERKRTEEALAAERSLLRTLVDHLPDAVYVKDDACRKTLANVVDVRNMGASSEAEALGKTDFDFFPHDLAAAFYADDQSVIQSGRPVLNREEMITLPDGTRGWQLTSKVPVRDNAGQVVGLVGIGHDITERKAREQEYQTIVRTAIDGFWIADMQGHFLDVNQAYCHLTGYSRDELLNMSIPGVEAVEKPEETAKRIRKVKEVGHDRFETRHRRKDSEIVDVDVSVNYLPIDSGLMFVFIRDITERKRAEEEIRQHVAWLEALRQVSLKLATELDLDVLLRSIVEQAIALISGRWGSFELYRPGLDALVSTAMTGNGPDLSGTPLRRGEGLAGKIWESGQPLVVDDYQHWQGRAAAYEGHPIRAMVGVPVRWGDEFLGVLNIESETVGAFIPVDADQLNLFAAQAAIAIHNAQLFETERAAREQAEKLLAATQALSASLDLQQVFERILTELRYVVPHDSASVQQLKGNRLEIIGGHGFPNLKELLGESFDLTAQDNPNREVLRTRAPLILDDAPAHYEGFRHEPHVQAGTRAWLGVPLLFGDRLIGLIALDKREPGFYTEEHARLALAFAAQAAIAIENARLYRQAIQAAERRAVLHRASQEVIRALHDPEQVYQAIHQAAAALMPTEAFVIVLRDEAGQQNEAVYLIDRAGRWPAQRIPANQGLSSQVIASGQSLLIDDLTFETAPQAIHFGGPEPVRAILAVPLCLGEKVIGMISAQSYQPEVYTAEDKVLLEMLAAHAAAALENARLYQETEQRLRELSQLFETSAALSTSLDLDTVLRTIAEHAATALSAEGCAISAWDRERDALVTLLDYSADPDWWQPATPGTLYPLAQYPASHRVLTSCQPLAVQRGDSDADAAEMAWMKKDEVVSLLMVPLVIGDRAIGMLELMETQQERPFAPNEIRLCQTLANEAAAALENARLYDETQRRNRELTLLNRVIAASATGQAIEPILEVVCREMALAFDVPQAAAALFKEERTEAVVVAEYLAAGRPSALGETIPVTDNPVSQHLLIRKTPLVIDDAQTDPRQAPIHDLMRRRGTVSLLLLPLIVDGEVVGSLGVDAIELRPFSAQEVALAQRVAEQVSGALTRARLEQTQRRLSMAIEQAAEGIVIIDAKGNILYANPAFEQSSGYSRAEALGQHLRILRSDKHDAAFYAGMWQVLRAGQIWQGRMVNRRKDGALYTVDSTITPVRDHAGEIVNYIATLRDVTRELQLEEQFRQAQKMEAIGRLAGGVAHDFNNLLTVIHLSTRLLERQLRPPDPLWQHLQRIQDASQRAANLTKQLLAFSRREIVEPQVLNLNQVLGNLDKMLRRLIGEDVELTLLPAGELWPVKIDPTQVEQIVVNLAVNARDAMPMGGKLTIETANVALDAAYTAQHLGVEPGEYVMLAVSDTGQGMTEEVKTHLFEPFFTTKEKGKGTGLGLATVFGTVKQNGGYIGVYSEVERGTTFKIYLPHVAASTAASTSPPRAAAARGTETLLVVEDEPQVRELTCAILRAQGYQVLTARDGVEALQVAEAHEGPIHLLLTDVVMPRLSGKALADQLLLTRPEMRVLFTSGYTDNAIVHHGVLAAGIHFLSKPFEIESLARKVRDVLDATERPAAEVEKEETP
jgi:PAS domain S-box-containing protein